MIMIFIFSNHSTNDATLIKTIFNLNVDINYPSKKGSTLYLLKFVKLNEVFVAISIFFAVVFILHIK